ncbi:Crp/Fnr family transcriptional regulator [Streptomyces mobaraensis]|uniref:Crp/Fnr family transcriptional regulator n=1 Tax=Streptomyces mobaraensis TaxID=35621 RepID=UPI00331A61CE
MGSVPMDTEAPFWSLLDATTRAALLHIGYIRQFPAKSTILHQDDTSSYLLVLRRGCVKVISCTEAGYPAVLAIRNAGDLLGEQGGLDGRPRSASLVALTDVTALVLPADRFATVLRERPGVGEAVRHVLSGRLREADRQRAATGSEAVRARLASLLLDLAERYGRRLGSGEVHILLPLSQDDLAGLVLSSRRTVSRVLEQWRNLSWVATGRHRIVISRPDALKRQAAHDG